MEEKFVDMKIVIQYRMDEFRQITESMQTNVAVLKKVMLPSCLSSNANASPKVQVPESKGFSGNRNAKELKNFLLDMGQFFKVARVPKAEKVSIIIMYLMSLKLISF